MSVFTPSWLYIKQHNKTGLKYFGMTSEVCVEKYPGSGKYWKLHIKQHGNDVATIWCQLFDNQDDLIEYAERFSKENNIVESADWANLVPESGVYGKSYTSGWHHTIEAREKISSAMKGKKTKGMTGQNQSLETKKKISSSLSGRKFDKNYNSKNWKITSGGTAILVNNLRKWCTENLLNYGSVHRNVKLRKLYRGYFIEEVIN